MKFRRTVFEGIGFSKKTAGFSLLEVIIALLAMSVLMLAVWSLMSTFTSTARRGEASIRRAELLRSLYRTIDSELQSIVIDEIDDSTASDDLNSRFGITSLQLSSGPRDSSSDSNEFPALIGTPHSLEFSTVSVPIDAIFDELSKVDEEVVDEANKPVTFPEIRRVRYEFAFNEQDQAVLGFVRRELSWSTSKLLENDLDASTDQEKIENSTFAKLDVEAMLLKQFGAILPELGTDGSDDDENDFQSSDEYWNQVSGANYQAPLPQPVMDVVLGIKRMQFRFFDGSVWKTSWDSSADNGLPVAIDIVFDLWRKDEQRQSLVNNIGGGVNSIGDDPSDATFETNSISQVVIDSEEIDVEWKPQRRFLFYLNNASSKKNPSSDPFSQ